MACQRWAWPRACHSRDTATMTDTKQEGGVRPEPGPVPADLIRQELDRMLASQIFRKTKRLINLLRFVVNQSLAGKTDDLSEKTIAQDLYGLHDFDPGKDPRVRGGMRDLRDKLSRYYAEPLDHKILISILTGYRPE